MPVRDIGDILDDPHLRSSGFFQRREHETEGAWYDMKNPVFYSAYEYKEGFEPPQLGQQTETILCELEASLD